MIRLTLLILFVLFLWVYAFRNWMVSLCGLILLTVLMQKDDMPSYLAGIQGLNLWNVTLVVVTIGWLLQRQSERQALNLSRFAIAAAGGYVTIIILAYVQAMLHIDSFPAALNLDPAQLLTVDYLINPLKFIWVAFLLAKGCNSPRRVRLALGTLVGLGVLYAILVVKVMPLESLQEGAGILRYRNRIDRQVGLHANNMAKVLALTFWSILATQRLWRGAWWSKSAVLAAYPVTFLGMALCYSRAGYLTFAAVGLVLGCVRWRKLLLLGPPVIILVAVFMPSVTGRLLMDFDQSDEQETANIDWNEVTAGRTGNLWPPIIEEIQKAPVFGHGRLAILHTPAYGKILATEEEVPFTPHNGYLEVLVDSGAIGLVMVLWVFLGAGILSYRLMRQRQGPLLVAVGAMGLVHSVGCLVNALSGGVLLPDQGMLGTLCAFGIVVRVWFGRTVVATPAFRAPRSAWVDRPPQRAAL